MTVIETSGPTTSNRIYSPTQCYSRGTGIVDGSNVTGDFGFFIYGTTVATATPIATQTAQPAALASQESTTQVASTSAETLQVEDSEPVAASISAPTMVKFIKPLAAKA